MKLLKFLQKLKRHKPILIRRVAGNSMLPGLKHGSLVIASGWVSLRPNDIIVLKHNGLEKIKRLKSLSNKRIVVSGDNPAASIDSRHFGDLPINSVVGRLVWILKS